MEIDCRALKRQAREDMGLPRPNFRVVTFLYILMTSGVSILCSLIPLPAAPDSGLSSSTVFLSLLLSLYGTVAAFGYTLWALWTGRRLNPGPGALLQGFSVAGRVIIMRLLIYIRLLGVALLISLLILPAFVFPSLLVPLVLAAAAAVLLIVSLSYALAPYLLADRPDDGASAAVRRSAQLMQGWKWQLFRLDLSFLGWLLLRSLLVAGACGFALWYSGLPRVIATLESADLAVWIYLVVNSLLAFTLSALLTLPLDLWLTPYREVTRARFYDLRLQAQQASAPQL